MGGNAGAGMTGQDVKVCLDLWIIRFEDGDGLVFRDKRAAAVDGLPQLANGDDEGRAVATGAGGEGVQHLAKGRHLPTNHVDQAGSFPVRDVGAFDVTARSNRGWYILQVFFELIDAPGKFCKVRFQSGAELAFSGESGFRRIKTLREMRHGWVNICLAVFRSEVNHTFLDIGKARRGVAHPGP